MTEKEKDRRQENLEIIRKARAELARMKAEREEAKRLRRERREAEKKEADKKLEIETKKKEEAKWRTGPRRSLIQRELDLAEMLKLMRRGYTQSMIAHKFGLSTMEISKDFIKSIRRIRKEIDTDLKRVVLLKLAEINEVKKEAWEAWELSKEECCRVVEEEIKNTEGNGRERKVTTTEKRLPDSKYLGIVLDCIRQERELQGLDPEVKLNVKAQVVNWDILAQEIPAGPVPDELEAEIQKALGMSTGEEINRKLLELGEGPQPPKIVNANIIDQQNMEGIQQKEERITTLPDGQENFIDDSTEEVEVSNKDQSEQEIIDQRLNEELDRCTPTELDMLVQRALNEVGLGEEDLEEEEEGEE